MRGSIMVLTLLAGVALAPAPLLAADGPQRDFTAADLFKLEGVVDPQISPDGSQIAYVRMSGDIMTDSYRPSIWLVDVKSGQQHPLVAAGSSPRWSPDGKRLAYVAKGEAGAQIFVRWMASGESSEITGLPETPQSLAWSPDGSQIAYIMHVPGEGLKLGTPQAKPEGAKWAKPLQIIDRVTYRFDGGGYAQPGYDQLFVASADGGAPRQLTFDKYDVGGPLSWDRDGNTILFSGNRNPDWQLQAVEAELYSLDIASGKIAALTSRKGPDVAPAISPDGKTIAWLGFDDHHRSNENLELYVMDRKGGTPHSLTASLDRSINALEWAGPSSIAVSFDDHGRTKVALVGMDGRLRVLTDAVSAGTHFDRPYTGGSFSISKTGVVAYTSGTTQRPADLWVTGGKSPRKLTSLNTTWMAGKAMAPVRKLPVTAPDGRPIDAWLVTPPGARPGQKFPLILEIHGGPHAAYGPSFATDMQLYAAHGYAVLYTNPRGSTSYGEDFARLIDRNYPGPDYDDLMAAVDAAIADGVADPDNLFVTGGSGGGVLTAWIVGKTHRFKAAAAQKPVINWTSESLTADLANYAPFYWFDKLPWQDPQEYWRRSPLSLVGNVKTPTLVVVGEQDFRTPVSESEQYYAALQLQGVPTAFVKVPDASHGGIAARPSQSAAKAAAILAWFDKYRTDKPVEGAAAGK